MSGGLDPTGYLASVQYSKKKSGKIKYNTKVWLSQSHIQEIVKTRNHTLLIQIHQHHHLRGHEVVQIQR